MRFFLLIKVRQRNKRREEDAPQIKLEEHRPRYLLYFHYNHRDGADVRGLG
jgi:hypothetical protein